MLEIAGGILIAVFIIFNLDAILALIILIAIWTIPPGLAMTIFSFIARANGGDAADAALIGLGVGFVISWWIHERF